MIHTDEDDEFERIANEAKLKGQPYYFDAKGESLSRAIGARKKEDDDDIQEYVRPWVGLTDAERLEALRSVDVATAVSLLMSQYEMPPTFKVYAEAIEAKLKEKNHG
jgi:hypothetical protein